MDSIYNRIWNKIGRKMSELRHMNVVGLNPLSSALLKTKNGNTVKRRKLFGKGLYYIRGNDLEHSLREIFVDEVYKANLSINPTIIDCGANIGLSVLYFKKRFPDAHITAFEPDKNNYQMLVKNIAEYGLSKVEAHQNAVWDKTETLFFKSITSLGSKIVDYVDEGSYPVEAISIKPWLTKGVVDFLKIDIEGAEYNVLKNIRNDLGAVKNIFIEYHSSFENEATLLEILDIIRAAGFIFYIKQGFDLHKTPFAKMQTKDAFDLQLNIFCFRKS